MSSVDLSGREAEVLRRAAAGETYRQIASDWGVEEITVRTTGARVLRKLGANTIAHAVHLAWESGLFRRERHGDHAGFAAHRYRDEEPCEACWAGERAYRAEQRQKRRQEVVSGPQGVQEAARGARDVRGAVRASSGRTAARGEAAA